MTITLACGHQSLDFPNDAIDVEYDDETIDHDEGGFVPCTVYATYCTDCAIFGIAEGALRESSHTVPKFVSGYNTDTTP